MSASYKINNSAAVPVRQVYTQTSANSLKNENIADIKDTIEAVIKRARELNMTEDEYLNGHTYKEITEKVNTYAENNPDRAVLVMDLVVNHAFGIINKYSGKITFEQMLARREANPDEHITDLAFNIIKESYSNVAKIASPADFVNDCTKPKWSFITVEELIARKNRPAADRLANLEIKPSYMFTEEFVREKLDAGQSHLLARA